MEALRIKRLYNQLVLTSEKALSFLKFKGTLGEEEDTKLWHLSPRSLFCMYREELETGNVCQLFNQYQVWEYIYSCFEALYTTGENYIVADIDAFIQARK